MAMNIREASAESGTEKLLIEGTGVRLPDDIMSVEEVAAMLSDTKTRENQEKNKKRLPTGGFCDNLNALQDKCEEEEQ